MRKTPLLKAVKDLFTSKKTPLTVAQIQSFLKEKEMSPNKTSLYRMLEKLTNENFIENILLDNKNSFYELKTKHHHHFYCDDCSTINCIEDQELEKNIHTLEEKLKEKGFNIQGHHFSLSGKCAKCT